MVFPHLTVHLLELLFLELRAAHCVHKTLETPGHEEPGVIQHPWKGGVKTNHTIGVKYKRCQWQPIAYLIFRSSMANGAGGGRE